MTHLYFHCSSKAGVLLDQRGRDLEDFADARDHAECFIRKLIARPGPEDWRSWLLYVSDAEGEEIFAIPFESIVGKLH